jgi:uncharacterized membrane protein
MTLDAYVLVVLSAAAHAWWNFLLKRSGGTQAVVGTSKVVEALLLGSLLLAGVAGDVGRAFDAWALPAVGAALVLVNYLFLTAAYREGDLSLVYPISRGAVLLFLPPLAFMWIGERLDAAGWAAILLIVAGIGLLQMPVHAVRGLATAYALLAAFVAACYTIWDKRAVQVLSPLLYFATYTVIVGIAYGLLVYRSGGGAGVRDAWRQHRTTIVLVAVLNSSSYLLALAALQTGKASYVIALRQLSIAGGALLGWWLLNEPVPAWRRAGILLVVSGCVLLGLAR